MDELHTSVHIKFDNFLHKAIQMHWCALNEFSKENSMCSSQIKLSACFATWQDVVNYFVLSKYKLAL